MDKDIQLKNYLYQFLTDERKEQFEKVLANRTRHFTVALENIFQAHNSNAVIRSCDCFGIQDCHIIETFNKFKACRGVSKGATKWVNVHLHDNALAAINNLKKEGYQIVATTPHTDDTELRDFDITKKSAFFFGAEKKGVSATVLENADVYLKIPMQGHTESLNISVSAAIILQYISQELKNKDDIKWKIPENDLEKIRLDWAIISSKRIDKHLKNFEENVFRKESKLA